MVKHKEFCGQCGFETDHDDNGCIYHQKYALKLVNTN